MRERKSTPLPIAELMEPQEQYLSMKDIGRILRISRWTVYKWVRRGWIHQYEPFVGSAIVRYKASELQAAMRIKGAVPEGEGDGADPELLISPEES